MRPDRQRRCPPQIPRTESSWRARPAGFPHRRQPGRACEQWEELAFPSNCIDIKCAWITEILGCEFYSNLGHETGNGMIDAEQMSAEIEELRDRLRNEKIRHYDELRQFAYAISHDLREPLRMVRSYTQLLEQRRGQQHDADRQEFLRYISDAIERAERLLADLVTYSLQLRPLAQPESQVDAEAVLGAVLLGMESSIRASGAQITHDPLPGVTFDFERLSQL